MKLGTSIAVAVGVFAVVAIVVLLLGVGISRSGGSYASGGPAAFLAEPPGDGSYAVVGQTYRSHQGVGIFGWDIVEPKYRAIVSFVVPPGCTPPAPSETMMANAACAGIPAEGEVAGGGTTSTGRTLASVSIEVTRACHDALEPGDRWPSRLPECD